VTRSDQEVSEVAGVVRVGQISAWRRADIPDKRTQAEVRNRCTITGGVEIGRLPGVVQLNMLVPMDKLDAIGIGSYVRQQYNL